MYFSDISDGSAKVTISDKGAGIPPERLPYLFDRFYKAEPDGLRYSGMGLGLFISAAIVWKHGCEVGVDSELGKAVRSGSRYLCSEYR